MVLSDFLERLGYGLDDEEEDEEFEVEAGVKCGRGGLEDPYWAPPLAVVVAAPDPSLVPDVAILTGIPVAVPNAFPSSPRGLIPCIDVLDLGDDGSFIENSREGEVVVGWSRRRRVGVAGECQFPVKETDEQEAGNELRTNIDYRFAFMLIC